MSRFIQEVGIGDIALPSGDTNPEDGHSNKVCSAQGHRMSSLPQSGRTDDEANTRPSSAKRVKCPYCSSDFSRNNMKSHLLVHTRGKPYQCDTCEVRFRRVSDLRRHTKLHTGERPHVCPKCDRSFARGDALARHNKGQGGCARRRSSVGNPDGDESYGESTRNGSEDESLPEILDDALDGGKPPSLLQAPTTSFQIPSVTPAVPGIRGPGSQLTMVSSIAPASIKVERENETDWSLGKKRSLLSDDNMSLVKCQVLNELVKYKPPTKSRVLHGQTDLFHVTAGLTMEWDPLGFINSQYPDNEDANLGSVIVLSGTVLHSQATTCSEYAHQTWPSQGLKVLAAFESAIDSGEGRASVSLNGIDINIQLGQEELGRKVCAFNVVSNDFTIIAEIFQQAVWMGAALRVSGSQRIEYSTFELEPVRVRDAWNEPPQFQVTYGTSEVSKEEQSCWLPIFTNSVIARGFPVPEREDGEQGVEVPLEIMAALGGARHATEFEGGLVLKGHSAMFVPVERHNHSIQWHLIRCSDEERMLYGQLRNERLKRAMLEEVDHESLRITRAFLGWWKFSETHLGTGDAAYDSIDWSPAGEAKRPTRFSGGNIGFQTMITGQLNFIMGPKDGKLHFPQKGPFQRIVQCAEKTPIVLYDLADRRAWFVPALDVMLHVIQTRHHLSPYNIDGKDLELTPRNPDNGSGAAAEAVADNHLRQLYERDFATEKDYCFKDAILDIWSQIERLMEKEDSVEAHPGLALHGTLRSKLHGWEFMSLVDEKNYRRKEVTIAKSSGGWVDLINDIDALVLFATGFGEVIRPVRGLRRLCHNWRSLPKNKDYLAAGVPILELLYSEAGSRVSRKHLSASHLQWHRGSVLFEECSHTGSDRCECDRTQQIYHDSLFRSFGRARPPGKLEENGCVAFGQAYHPFKPTKSIAGGENAVYILPNISIQDAEITEKVTGRDDTTLSPSPPALPPPELGEVNGYGARSPKRPLSEEAASSKRRRNVSHIQKTSLVTLREPNNGNDQISVPEDGAVCPAEYQLMLKQNMQSRARRSVISTQTAYPPKAGYVPVDAQQIMDPKAKIEDYSNPYGCSYRTRPMVGELELPGSIKFVGTTNDALDDTTNIVERRERQRA